MKLTINGVEQKESDLKGETLEAILDMMVKNSPGSYVRLIWLDQKNSQLMTEKLCKKNLPILIS